MIYRQGDVMLITVSEVPQGKEVSRENGRLILAYGEVTGHAHAIVAPTVKMIEKADIRYIVASEQFEVLHEEHLKHVIPAGIYEIRHQREYVEAAIPRRVID